jgi:putative ABC transport system permease protein
MVTLLGDLRVALRALIRKPAFTCMAAATLVMGIGLTSAIFAVVQGVLLTPPPYPHPDRVVCLSAGEEGEPYEGSCPVATWAAWRDEAHSFESIAPYWWDFEYLIRDDGSQFIQGLDVTTNYFDLIGVKPLLGQTFSPLLGTTRPDAIAGFSEIILGYGLWQRTFKGDPHIIGQAIHVSRIEEPLTIIGVMPPGLKFLPADNENTEPNFDVNAPVDYWRPVMVRESNLRSEQCDVIGRLRTGVSLGHAQAELAVITGRHARAEGISERAKAKAGWLMALLNREGRRLLLPLMGAVALLFLITCGNIATLLLGRGLQQQREYAVRCALGAGRAHLFSVAMAEPLLLAFFGGVAGCALALAIVKIIKAFGGFAIPRLDAVAVGWPVIGVVLGLALLAAILTGALPALRAGQAEPASGMSGGGRSGSIGRAQRRWLAAAAVLQIVLSTVLLAGAGLLLGTVANLARLNPGFDTKNILTLSVTPMEDDFIGFHRRALECVSALPGVEKAAFAWGVPLTGNKWTGLITVEGQSDANKSANKTIVSERAVTPGYFDALKMNLAAGRDFRANDTWDNWTNKAVAAPGDTPFVAVINQTMARQRFGTGNCIGKKLHTGFFPKRPLEVIGVVEDMRSDSLAQKPGPEVYFCYWQAPAFTKHLIVKSASAPRTLVAAVQRALRAVDPKVAVDHVKTLDQIRADSIAPQIFAMWLLTGFAAIGAVLALVGIYAVMSLSVNSRNREIAIRMAIGAQYRDVLRLVLAEGLKLIVAGVVVGIAAALALGRVLRAYLFGVGPSDPLTMVSVAMLFMAVALLACFVPARRATHTDPVTALRCE